MNEASQRPEFGRFFLPGPTEVHPDVLDRQRDPMIAHRGKEMERLLSGMIDPLKRIFRTVDRHPLIGSCSATGFMEMAVRCGVRHRVLSLVGGAFGERFAAIAAACGCEVVRLNVPLGRTVEPEMVDEALQRSDVDAVTLVHSETSTGALAPLADLANVVHGFDDVLLLVDGVTSVGGLPVETDDWDLDFVLTGSQKAFALPPGLALAVASERMLERAKHLPDRGAYLDVIPHVEALQRCQPPNTPALSLLYALDEQLARIESEGGVEGRWDRHRKMLETVERWVDGRGGELGFSYLPVLDRRSWTVSCLNAPAGVNGRDIVVRLRDLGWVIGTGYGDLKEETIRI
ncbi:MAG: pyridoxal-phosphate-dependent aminotransferase family protein, partial [Gemmatimonadales bacterium]